MYRKILVGNELEELLLIKKKLSELNKTLEKSQETFKQRTKEIGNLINSFNKLSEESERLGLIKEKYG